MASEGKGGASKKQLPDIDKSIDVGFNAGWVAGRFFNDRPAFDQDERRIKTKPKVQRCA